MNELIKHLVDNNLERIVDRSLLNCHCEGLHSIMLIESPEQTIRLYYAEPGSHLYKNSPLFFADGMSLGFHPHHCNLTLHCIMGRFWNWSLQPYSPTVDPEYVVNLQKYQYKSAITGTKQGFTLLNEDCRMVSGPYLEIKEGDTLALNANELHTVVVNPFERAAWLVYEGKEDPNYVSVCYSTTNLQTVNSEKLYKKPTAQDVLEMLKRTGLL